MSILVMGAVAMTMILAVAMLPEVEAVRTARGTALAVAVLLLSLPLVDSVAFGSTIRAETAGFVAGLPLGFLLRQADQVPHLAAGGERVAAFAVVISIGLVVRRVWRRRQRA